MYKVAVIGAGVIGGLVARQLNRHEKEIVILERFSDVAMGQSKANSGIVHGGYDPIPGSLKAQLNVRGSEMMEQVCKELHVKYRKNGTLVVAFSEEEMNTVKALEQRGIKNGVKRLKVIDGKEVRRLEKNLSEKIVGALYVPTGAIVCPYELTIHAVGNAMDNGATLLTEFQVTQIEREKGSFHIYSKDGRRVQAEMVINCAGVHSDEIARMVGDDSFQITPRRGEYYLLDKEAGSLVDRTIFRVPTKMGKGVLATKTVDGNVLLGPTSVDVEEKESKKVTTDGLNFVRKKESELFESIPWEKVITQFTGLRAHGNRGDFIINSPFEKFINAAGVESPGLSSAPAVAELIEKMAIDMGISPEIRESFNPLREKEIPFHQLSDEEKNKIIAEEPAFGRIVCRCEEITEGEIRQAIRQNPPTRDVDGIKRRTRSGMGRCQGGFCMPGVAEIIADECNIPFEEVTKMGEKSRYTYGKVKGE